MAKGSRGINPNIEADTQEELGADLSAPIAVSLVHAQEAISVEFLAEGIHFDIGAVGQILELAATGSSVDAEHVIERLDGRALASLGTDTQTLVDAVGRAIGGKVVYADNESSRVIHQNNFSIEIGSGASLDNANIQQGRDNVAVNAGSSTSEILDAFEGSMTQILRGAADVEGLEVLAKLVESRPEISEAEIRNRTERLLISTGVTQSTAERFRRNVAAQAIGGALGSGIVAGVATVASQLPV